MTDNKIVSLPTISKGDVEEEIRKIAKADSENVVLLDHAIDRMEQRDINSMQVFRVLRSGERVSDIEWDTEQERGWKCAFRKTTAGCSVTVVAKLVERGESTCLVVTVF